MPVHGTSFDTPIAETKKVKTKNYSYDTRKIHHQARNKDFR
jgi:hypothetical protein